jgi:hypothetical protein
MRGARTFGAAALGLAGLVAAFVAPLNGPANAGTDHEVKAARSATHTFVHPGAAKKAGYGLFKDVKGIACIDMKGMGGMGVHYVNGARVDGKIQLRHPEALVYRFTGNGHLKLSALEYLVTRQAWRVDHPTGRPELFGHRFNLTQKGNRFGLPTFFSLHAWVWDANPAGQFAMFNPKVNCPGGI